MPEQVKMPTAKPEEDSDSISTTYMVEKNRTTPQNYPLTFTHGV